MFKEEKQNKIFGRRKGKKLSNLQQKNLNKYLNDFSIFPNDNQNKAKLKKINPYNLFHDLKIMDIRLEIGFGMGDFLFEKALSLPNVGFIGCEIFENGVASLLNKIIKYKISNLRIHFGNCLDLIYNLNLSTLNEIYVLFPDPWPKNKHKKRRFFNENNAFYLCSLLEKNGTINIATDIDDYAAQILGIMKKKKNFDLINSNLFQNEISNTRNFNTKYEKKAIDSGRNTNYLIFKKKYE